MIYLVGRRHASLRPLSNPCSMRGISRIAHPPELSPCEWVTLEKRGLSPISSLVRLSIGSWDFEISFSRSIDRWRTSARQITLIGRCYFGGLVSHSALPSLRRVAWTSFVRPSDLVSPTSYETLLGSEGIMRCLATRYSRDFT